MRTDETGAIPYEKSNNVETSLFRTQGRITRKAFSLRLVLCVVIWSVFHILFVFVFQRQYISKLNPPIIQEDTVHPLSNDNPKIKYLFICSRQEAVIKDLIEKGYQTYGPANQFKIQYNIFKPIDLYIVPVLLALFLLIQAIKRAHDVNKSGWSIMIPFYNIYILLSKGTNDDNDFGLLPHSEKKSPSYQYEETGPN